MANGFRIFLSKIEIYNTERAPIEIDGELWILKIEMVNLISRGLGSGIRDVGPGGPRVR